MMAVNAVYQAMKLIKQFEGGPNGGFAAEPYRCPAGKQTVGWGHVILPGERLDVTITEELADTWLRSDAINAWLAIGSLVSVKLKDSMAAALISFVFNVGQGAFRESTLLKKLNAGDYQGAADQLLRWDKATNPKTGRKVRLAGLTRRRRAERDLFLSEGVPG